MHEFYSKYMFLSEEFRLLEVENPVFYDKNIDKIVICHVGLL